MAVKSFERIFNLMIMAVGKNFVLFNFAYLFIVKPILEFVNLPKLFKIGQKGFQGLP